MFKVTGLNGSMNFFLASVYRGHSNKKCIVVSICPQAQLGLSIICFLDKCELSILQLSLSRVCKICSVRLPNRKCLGVLQQFELSTRFKLDTEGFSWTLIGRSFQSFVVDGRKDCE